ncbi:MAG: YihY/virulence factor BrkB family protein [Thermoleophilia bacterium]
MRGRRHAERGAAAAVTAGRRVGRGARFGRRVVDAYLEARGNGLAAGVAYFALLSLVPLLFVAISIIGLLGEQTETSALVEQLRRTFPGSSADDLIRAITALQDRSLSIGLIGFGLLLWGSLGLFGALTSALDAIHGVPGRPFLRQRGRSILLVLAFSLALALALLVATTGAEALDRMGVGSGPLRQAIGIGASLVLLTGFVWSAYTLLPTRSLGWRRTLPGAVTASILLGATVQLLPVYVRLTSRSATLQALGGVALLLVWLYVMAILLLLGEVLNREIVRARTPRPEPPHP